MDYSESSPSFCRQTFLFSKCCGFILVSLLLIDIIVSLQYSKGPFCAFELFSHYDFDFCVLLFLKTSITGCRSPDGYSLFACSLDGTVATFHFDANELGTRLSDAELDDLKKSRYGDVRGRQANLAESPAQLLLEAASAKQTPMKKTSENVSLNQASSKVPANAVTAAKVPKSQTDNGKKSEGVTSDGLNKAAPSTRLSSPVKQREYRRPDGRKRIIPEAVGVSIQQDKIAGAVQTPAPGFTNNSVDGENGDNGVIHSDTGFREGPNRKTVGGSTDLKERSGVTARATVSESLVIEKVPVAAGKDGSICIEQTGAVKDTCSLASSGTLSIRVCDKKEGEDMIPFCLEARPREHTVNDVLGVGNTFVMKDTELICTKGMQTFWSDKISGKVTVLAGNANFWAAGSEDGSLQVNVLKQFF